MNVFVVYAKPFWLHKHSIVRRHVIECMCREFDHVEITGPGWSTYRVDRSLQWNIDNLTQSEPFDFCWMYKPQGHGKRTDIPRILSADDCQIPIVQRMHEFWWCDEPKMAPQASEELEHCDLAVYTHENDGPRFERFGINAVHIPQTAEKRVFYNSRPHSNRPTDIVLTGTISESVYPLRSKFLKTIRASKMPGSVKHIQHCGYWIDDVEKQAGRYAEVLASSKISLCCTSKWKYALGKHVESAMAGCAVATDLPDDLMYCNSLGDHVIRIDPAWGQDEIADCLEDWLSRPGDLQDLAVAGQKEAMAWYTHERYCSDLRLVMTLR